MTTPHHRKYCLSSTISHMTLHHREYCLSSEWSINHLSHDASSSRVLPIVNHQSHDAPSSRVFPIVNHPSSRVLPIVGMINQSSITWRSIVSIAYRRIWSMIPTMILVEVKVHAPVRNKHNKIQSGTQKEPILNTNHHEIIMAGSNNVWFENAGSDAMRSSLVKFQKWQDARNFGLNFIFWTFTNVHTGLFLGKLAKKLRGKSRGQTVRKQTDYKGF